MNEARQPKGLEIERLVLACYAGKPEPARGPQDCLESQETYAVDHATKGLQKLGLIADDKATELGNQVLEVLAINRNLTVRLALTVIAASKHGCIQEAVILASVLGCGRNFLICPREKAAEAQAAHSKLAAEEDRSDLARLLRAYRHLVDLQRAGKRSEMGAYCNEHFISLEAFHQANGLHRALIDHCIKQKIWKRDQAPATQEQLALAFLTGCSDQLMIPDGSIGLDCVDGWGIHAANGSIYSFRHPRFAVPARCVEAPRARRGGTIRLATEIVAVTLDQLQAVLGDRLQVERWAFECGDGFGDNFDTVYCTETWSVDGHTIQARRIPAPADHPSTLACLTGIILAGGQNKTQQGSSLALLAELQGLSQRAALPTPSKSSVQQWLQVHLGSTNSTAQAVGLVPAMTWADLAALTNTPTLEADAAEVRRNFPDSITVNGVSLPATYNGNGGITIVVESSQIDKVLPHLKNSDFPAKFADRVVNVIVKLPVGNAICGNINDEDFCQLRREVARKINAVNSVSLPAEADKLVQSVQVKHPGKEEVIWLVAGAKVEFDDEATAMSQARLTIERWLKDRALATARKYFESVGCPVDFDDEQLQQAVAFGIAVLRDAVTDPQRVQEVLTTVERQIVAQLHGIFQPRIDARIELLAAAKPLGEQARQKQNEAARVAVRKALELLRDDRDSSYAPPHSYLQAARVQLDLARGLLPTLAGDQGERLQLGAEIHALQQRIDKERKGEQKTKLKAPLLALKQRLATEDLDVLRGEFNLLKARTEEKLRQPAQPAGGLSGGYSPPPKRK